MNHQQPVYGDAPLTPDEVAKLREAYRLDLGDDSNLTDQELVGLARETLQIFQVLVRIATQQSERRELEGSTGPMRSTKRSALR